MKYFFSFFSVFFLLSLVPSTATAQALPTIQEILDHQLKRAEKFNNYEVHYKKRHLKQLHKEKQDDTDKTISSEYVPELFRFDGGRFYYQFAVYDSSTQKHVLNIDCFDGETSILDFRPENQDQAISTQVFNGQSDWTATTEMHPLEFYFNFPDTNKFFRLGSGIWKVVGREELNEANCVVIIQDQDHPKIQNAEIVKMWLDSDNQYLPLRAEIKFRTNLPENVVVSGTKGDAWVSWNMEYKDEAGELFPHKWTYSEGSSINTFAIVEDIKFNSKYSPADFQVKLPEGEKVIVGFTKRGRPEIAVSQEDGSLLSQVEHVPPKKGSFYLIIIANVVLIVVFGLIYFRKRFRTNKQ